MTGGFKLGIAMALPNCFVACFKTSAVTGPSRKWWWKSSGRVMVSLVPSGTDVGDAMMSLSVWILAAVGRLIGLLDFGLLIGFCGF